MLISNVSHSALPHSPNRVSFLFKTYFLCLFTNNHPCGIFVYYPLLLQVFLYIEWFVLSPTVLSTPYLTLLFDPKQIGNRVEERKSCCLHFSWRTSWRLIFQHQKKLMSSRIFPAIFTSVSYSQAAMYLYVMSSKINESELITGKSSCIIDEAETSARNKASRWRWGEGAAEVIGKEQRTEKTHKVDLISWQMEDHCTADLAAWRKFISVHGHCDL